MNAPAIGSKLRDKANGGTRLFTVVDVFFAGVYLVAVCWLIYYLSTTAMHHWYALP